MIGFGNGGVGRKSRAFFTPAVFTKSSRFGIAWTLIAVFLSLALGSCGSDSKSTAGPGERKAHSIGVSDTLSELDSIKPLAGVDENVWNALVAKFESELSATGRDRFSSRVPTGDDNRVNDLELFDSGGNDRLRWTYKNVGDYDQSGEVGIPDITPIALHYSHIRDQFGNWPDASDEIIDGDMSGEIGIPDVTPIALNYLAAVEGYNIETASTPGGPYTQIGFVPLPSPPSSGRLILNVALPAGAQDYLRVRPMGPSSEVGSSSNVIVIAQDVPPSIIDINRSEGGTGEALQFIASVTGTQPIAVDWDFGGGATPNTASGASTVVTLGDAGEYTITLTATNDFGSDEATFPLTVTLVGDAPVITFITPTVVQSAVETAISATVSGTEPFTYAWDFGGGSTPNTSDEVAPVITPGAAGIYNASLTVTNIIGSDTLDFSLEVKDDDVTPPVWDSTIGITAATPVVNSNEITVQFGRATDNVDENPRYHIYYNKSSLFDIENLEGQFEEGVWWILHSDPPPYEVTIVGLEPGEDYTFLVRTRDDALPQPNFDTNSVMMNATVDPNGLNVGVIAYTPDNDPPIGTPITFTAQVSGGSGNYTGIWSDGDDAFGFFFDPKSAAGTVSAVWGTAQGDVWYTIGLSVSDGAGRMGKQVLNSVYVSPGTPLSLAADVYPMIQVRCIGCHSGAFPQENLNMGSAALAHSNLVGVNSQQKPAMKRVQAFDPENSYLIHKITGRPGISGNRMPPGGPFFDATQTNVFLTWIFGGALQ